MKYLKGNELQVGMIVIATKGKAGFPMDPLTAINTPLIVALITDYPYVLFEYEKNVYEGGGPFSRGKKVGITKDALAVNVKRMRFKQVSQDYVTLLKDVGEEESEHMRF